MSIVLSVIGVLLAIAALVVAIRAWRASNEQLKMQRVEHAVFLDRVTARAALRVSAQFTDDDAAEQTVDNGVIFRILRIHVRNGGEKAAERASVRVVAPVSVVDMHWSNAAGLQIPEELPVPDPDGLLITGQTVPARRLDRTIGPLDLNTDGVTVYVFMRIDVGEVRTLTPETTPPSTRAVSLRVEVASADMPPDQPNVAIEKHYLFTGPVRGA